MTTYVLVHGAWHGGWCWHKVVARLEALGHRVCAPDMKGHGIDRTPTETLNLEMLASGIVDVVEAQPEPVVLVGHSFGGTIIGEVGERCPEKIAKLVYLAAFVVPGGKSMADLNAPDEESLLGPNMVYAANGLSVTTKPGCLKDVFYGECAQDDVALARTLLVAEGTAAFATPSTATASRWGQLRSAYIECLRDRAIGIKRQRHFASFLVAPKVHTLDTDHSPFFSAPDRLVAALIEA
jgi:pimeloyl-ACP methyl ester carboxylesterase